MAPPNQTGPAVHVLPAWFCDPVKSLCKNANASDGAQDNLDLGASKQFCLAVPSRLGKLVNISVINAYLRSNQRLRMRCVANLTLTNQSHRSTSGGRFRASNVAHHLLKRPAQRFQPISATPESSSATAMARKLRILALHSFRTSGKTFALQVNILRCSFLSLLHTPRQEQTRATKRAESCKWC